MCKCVLMFTCVVLPKIWEERNDRIFKDIAKSSKDVLESSIFTALFWCKDLSPFKYYHLNFLVANWKHLFVFPVNRALLCPSR